MQEKDRAVVTELLQKAGREDFIPLQENQLAGDGSSRRFYRLASGGETLIAVLPAGEEAKDRAESRAAYHIGGYLLACGTPVPAIYGWDEASGGLLFQDLGNTRLQDVAHTEEGRQLYRQLVRALAGMNCRARGIDSSWCWDSPCYDRSLMLERESGYFLRAFWQGLLGQEVPIGLAEEFSSLADAVSLYSTDFFLHRDFQSRNIMIHAGRPSIIDFQGGRRGPLGYDLASLLYDPYVDLDEDFRALLWEDYLAALGAQIDISREDFAKQYSLLACQRSLQIIGAFSWLSAVAKKTFFVQFIRPSLLNLEKILSAPYYQNYRVLRQTVRRGLSLYR
ncbi:aminoglycoside phosphotransferase family protein [Desulfotalea psychrophila]|uniref:Aminoglycoside phosphotransferase domain-containing protein n=1 Tax=Desulfotalea psychrophila (strain LSv54 / DSM 12343) TaxID=177439 RepID=Q6AJ11_DESPS|nr:phosphotransferase [Desulfotalea psychrophila]CAG37669.1 conserved hypothetical protein [Desulfotalea psychrophila LSv54]